MALAGAGGVTPWGHADARLRVFSVPKAEAGGDT